LELLECQTDILGCSTLPVVDSLHSLGGLSKTRNIIFGLEALEELLVRGRETVVKFVGGSPECIASWIFC
jgi:hypothetical protein